MNRTGIVMDKSGDFASVKLMKHAACGDCGACHMGAENMNITVECVNESCAEVGDRVEIDMKTQNVLGAAFIAYVIPLFVLVVGIAVSNAIMKGIGYEEHRELISFLVGASLTAITYFVIKLNDEKFYNSKKYLSTITKIL